MSEGGLSEEAGEVWGRLRPRCGGGAGRCGRGAGAVLVDWKGEARSRSYSRLSAALFSRAVPRARISRSATASGSRAFTA